MPVMCGIFALFQGGNSTAGTADLEALGQYHLDLLAHRGPDEDHVVVCKGNVLAQNRLAIVDVGESSGRPSKTAEQ